jgi:DNA-binding protein H-NS
LRSLEKRKRDEALSDMQKVAEKHGLALKDVMQGATKRSVQVPKYEHPENPALTWSGRGRQPDWFKEALGAGHSRDDLLIA